MSTNGSNGHADSPAESASDLQASYVMCRTVRHAWYPYVDNGLENPGAGGVRISLFCDRCTMKRHDIRTRYGQLIGRRYDPPRDYRLSGEVTSDNLWAEFLVRNGKGEITIRKRARTRQHA